MKAGQELHERRMKATCPGRQLACAREGRAGREIVRGIVRGIVRSEPAVRNGTGRPAALCSHSHRLTYAFFFKFSAWRLFLLARRLNPPAWRVFPSGLALKSSGLAAWRVFAFRQALLAQLLAESGCEARREGCLRPAQSLEREWSVLWGCWAPTRGRLVRREGDPTQMLCFDC